MTAENNVDQLILDSFYKNYRQLVMIDIGAAKPDFLSIGQGFRNRGFRVIGIEPNPMFCALHKKIGNICYEYACSDTDADDQDFYVVDSKNVPYENGFVTYESFSSLGIKGRFKSLLTTIPSETNKIKVKVRKLDTILTEHEPNLHKVDVVSIDTEGWELNVMRGFDIKKYQPDIIIMENAFFDHSYSEFMTQLDFTHWKTENLNQIWIRNT